MSMDTSKYIFNPGHYKLIRLVFTVNFTNEINEILLNLFYDLSIWEFVDKEEGWEMHLEVL